MAQMAVPNLQVAISQVLQPINWAGDPTRAARLQDGTVARVKGLLIQYGDVDGSARPRTYALLYLSHLTHFHDAFRGYSDDHLPYTDWTLPRGIRERDETACKHFLEFQHLVISEERQRLGPITRMHVRFENVEACPLRLIRLLGQGGFGTVNCVKGKYSGQEYARKTFQHRGDAAKINSFKRELEILKDVRHHHLVRFIGSYQDPEWLAFTMLPVAEGDLSRWLKSHLGDSLIQRFFGCLASAVAYLHKKNVRHKDIKPLNVLVCNNEVILSDFGSSGKWQDPDQSVTRGDVPYAYTHKYAPLEVLEASDRNRASDIFSLGCVFLEMISALFGYQVTGVTQYLVQHGTGSHWYSDNKPAVDSWVGFLRTKNPSKAYQSILEMTAFMMDADKSKRPSASTLAGCILGLGTDFACKRCHQEPTIQYLESKGIRVSEPHARGLALCQAASVGNLDIFQHLLRVTDDLSYKATHNGTLKTAVEIAAAQDHSEIVHCFLSHCRNNNMLHDVTGSLACALMGSSHRTVEMLLNRGADPFAPYWISGITPRTLIYIAASRGNVEALKVMVQRRIDLTRKDSATGRTVLHGAVRGKQIEALKYLLAQKLDVNAKDNAGVTPFHEAAVAGRADVAVLLAQAGADPNICDGEGYYPMSRAVLGNHAHMIAPLVHLGADPRLRDSRGDTAAGLATRWAHLAPLDAILTSTGTNNHYDKNGASLLHIAVLSNQPATVEVLLRRTPREINYALKGSNMTPLHYAAQFGSETVVQMLLNLPQAPTRTINSLGYTPLRVSMDVRKDYNSISRQFVVRDPVTVHMIDPTGGTPLRRAVLDGALEFTRFLVEKGASLERIVDLSGQRPLHVAAANGNASMTRLLLDLGAQVNVQTLRGVSPLHLAAAMGHGEVVDLLLGRGASVYATNSEGRDAFRLAACNGHVATVQLLGTKGYNINHLLMVASECGDLKVVQTVLDAGADINTRDAAWRSSLMLAIERGRTDVVKTLLERGCEAEMKNARDMNPLMLAVRLNNKDAVKALIDRGVHLDTQDKMGKTALSRAAREGYTDIGRLLVAGGANVDLAPDSQPTPLYRAAHGGHDEIAWVLIEGGADVQRAIRCAPLHTKYSISQFLHRFEDGRNPTSRISQRILFRA